MRYIDTHCHLNFKEFDEDRQEIIDCAIKNDLGMINIGTGLETSQEVVELARENYEKNPNMWAMIGLHPIYTDTESEFLRDEFQKLLDENRAIAPEYGGNKIVGVGECGLDYFHLKGETDEEISAEKKAQEKVFRAQIEFAIENNLPIMIHCRNAYDDVIEILKEYKEKLIEGEMGDYKPERLRGNCHFFAGTIDHAKELLDMDFTVSFTGVITFAEQYRELVKYVPLDLMHAETDSPYVAPVPFRGRRNEPNNVIKVVNRIADIKEEAFEDVEKQLIENAKRLFNI